MENNTDLRFSYCNFDAGFRACDVFLERPKKWDKMSSPILLQCARINRCMDKQTAISDTQQVGLNSFFFAGNDSMRQ